MSEAKGDPFLGVKLGWLPVQLHASFVLVAVGLAWDRPPPQLASWALASLVGIFVHELGHAVAGRRLGLSPRIRLYLLGGLTTWDAGPRPSARGDLVLSLAGPLAGFAAGGLVYGLSRLAALEEPFATSLVRDFVWVTVGWGVLNLAPIWPLDGGQALHAVLRHATGRDDRTAVHELSIVTAAGLLGLSVALETLFGALWSLVFLTANLRDRKEARTAELERRRLARLDAAWTAYLDARLDEARREAEAVVAEATTEQVRSDAHAVLAYVHLARNDAAAARAHVDAVGDRGLPAGLAVWVALAERSPEEAVSYARQVVAGSDDPTERRIAVRALLEGGALDDAEAALREEPPRPLDPGIYWEAMAAHFQAGRFEACAALAPVALARGAGPDAPYNAACAYARLGRLDDAAASLEAALAAGFADPDGLAADEDLAPLRADPRFPGWVERAAAQVAAAPRSALS